MIISVPKMMCSHCQAKIESALNKIDGLDYEVNLAEKKVIIKNDKIDKKIICKVISDAGYSNKIVKK